MAFNKRIFEYLALADLAYAAAAPDGKAGYQWGDTAGENGGYGRERLQSMIDKGYAVRTGSYTPNQLGGVWPEVAITPAGREALSECEAANARKALQLLDEGAIARIGMYPLRRFFVVGDADGVPEAIVRWGTFNRWLQEGAVEQIGNEKIEDLREYRKPAQPPEDPPPQRLHTRP